MSLQDEPRSETLDSLNWGSWTDWAQLVRLPNAFTVISDSFAAAIIVGSGLAPWLGFLFAMLASLCAYWAGMIFNDVFDIEADRISRPTRPLPAGRISPVIAGHVATVLLLIGPVLILAATNFFKSQPLWMGSAFGAAVALSITVKAYNSPLKNTFLGPLLMGSCRALNILMVGSCMFALGNSEGLPRELLWLAAGVGIYIMGVTVYAFREEATSSTAGLGLGIALEIAGLVVIGGMPIWSGAQHVWHLDSVRGYPLLVGLIGITVINRGVIGLNHPVPRKIQMAVKHAILTLILLDAAVVMMWAGPWYAGTIAIMLLPALLSALRFRST